MNSCPDCANAAENVLSGLFTSSCFECSARALAHSPAYAESAKSDAITRGYQDRLMNTFGDSWRTAHVRVRAWALAIEEAKK